MRNRFVIGEKALAGYGVAEIGARNVTRDEVSKSLLFLIKCHQSISCVCYFI